MRINIVVKIHTSTNLIRNLFETLLTSIVFVYLFQLKPFSSNVYLNLFLLINGITGYNTRLSTFTIYKNKAFSLAQVCIFGKTSKNSSKLTGK